LQVILAGFSAFLLIYSFPPYNLSWLAFFALVPLMIALYDSNLKTGAALGFITGLGFYSSLFAWAKSFGNEVWIALSIEQAIFWALWGGLVGWYRQKSPAFDWRRLVFPFLAFLAMEWLKGLGPLGLIWGNLGYSQHGNLPMIQSVSLLGYYWIAFLVLLGNLAALSALLRLTGLTTGKLPLCLSFAALLILNLIYGRLALSRPEPVNHPFKAGLVQVDMDMKIKWNQAFLEQTLKYLEQATAEAARKGARLVIFPETSVPDDFIYGSHLEARLRKMAKDNRLYLLFGAPRPFGYNYLNAAILVSPEGELLGEYDKRHLVPFAEYLPLDKLLRRFSAFDRVQNFMPGKGELIFSPAIGKFGVLTCFESAFSAIARKKVLLGSQFLVVITNDAWFELSPAAQHHLSWGVFRALENRRWFIQAANTGISAFVSPRGEIVERSGLYAREVLIGQAGTEDSKTLYSQIGDLFGYLCLGGFFLLLGFSGQGKTARKPKLKKR